jgi:hypothetical protein
VTKSYKIAGQAAPSATTNTTLYTVPADTTFIASTLCLVNRDTSGAASAFRVAVVKNGETIDTKHYIEYDKLLESRGSRKLTLGMSLSAGDAIVVYADTANLSFSLFGVEITA